MDATAKEKLEKYYEKNTPCPEGKCHCGGQLYRKVIDFLRGSFTYGFPKCDICGRIYVTDTKTLTKGERKFMEMLNTHMTI